MGYHKIPPKNYSKVNSLIERAKQAGIPEENEAIRNAKDLFSITKTLSAKGEWNLYEHNSYFDSRLSDKAEPIINDLISAIQKAEQQQCMDAANNDSDIKGWTRYMLVYHSPKYVLSVMMIQA